MTHHHPRPNPDAHLASSLSHVYWIGGSPCAGKSTIADMLGERFGSQVYHVDDDWEDRQARATEADQPVMTRIGRMGWNELWTLPLDRLVDAALSYYAEEFSMIVDDLLALPPTTPIIAEGAALLPESVASVRPDDGRTIWMVPSEAFQRVHYSREKRPWIDDILAECDDPDRAFDNWMDRDVAFARRVARDATNLSPRLVHVDGRATLDENAAIVAQHFRLGDIT